MDAVSTTLTAVSALKEVYLVARFIWKVAAGAAEADEQKRELVLEFDTELLHLRSFWIIFIRADGNLLDDDALNEAWLEKVREMAKMLRFAFLDYANVAALSDDEYKEYVWDPSSENVKDITKLPPEKIRTIVVASKSPEVHKEQSSESDKKPKEGRGWFPFQFRDSKFVKGTARVIERLSWELHNKEKLQDALKQFQRWNEQLGKLIPYILDTLRKKEDKDSWKRFEGHAIFAPHVRLRQIVEDPKTAATNAQKLRQPNPSEMTRPRTIVEQKSFEEENRAQTERDIGQLAMLLSTASNAGAGSFRTLPFEGFIKHKDAPRYDFLFGFPDGVTDEEPKTLHDLLITNGFKDRVSLAQRFQIAHALAQAIGAFHSDGWVHKSIRSHAVKFFVKEGGEYDLANPYLTDFEFSRPDGGFTRRQTAPSEPERSAYRHPERDGPPTKNFNKVHDIYSLGIVLLEIGLWEAADRFYEEWRVMLKEVDEQKRDPSSRTIKKNIKANADMRLVHRMGVAYRDAVMACLDDQLNEYLGTDGFAMTFEKFVVHRVDAKRLLE